MVRPENLGFHGANADRVNEVFAWIIAFDAFDYCDPAPLADLLASDATIPPELRPLLADIVSGRRKPNKKAASKLKIPAAERMKMAGALSAVLGLIDMLKHDPIIDLSYPLALQKEAMAIDLAAMAQGVEPIAKLRELEGERDRAIKMAMNHFCVSRETIENLLRDLREKIRNYPIV